MDRAETRRPQTDELRFPRWQRFVRLLWAIGVAAVVGLAWWLGSDPDRWSKLIFIPDSPIWIVTAVSQIGLLIAGEFLISLMVGFLSAASLAPARTRASWIRFLFAFLTAFFLSFLLVSGLRTVANGPPWILPSIVSLASLIAGCVWGSWLGAGWIGSSSTIGWAFRQLLTSVTVIVLGAGALFWMSLAPTRSIDVPEKVTTAQRRRLVERFQQHDPRDLNPQETAQVTLSQDELNQLANWGLSLLPGEHAARIQLFPEEVALAATWELPAAVLGKRYVNLTIAGRPVVRAGEIGFAPTTLKLGRLKAPSEWLSLSGPLMVSEQWRHEATEPFFRSLQNVSVGENAISVTYRHFELNDGIVSDALVGLGVVDDLKEATAAHVENLIQTAQSVPRLTFSQCMQAAFRKAEERSVENDAQDENRAAILSLGYLLGHAKIRTLVGESLPEPPPDIRSRFGRVTLRGRRDWTRHFVISAALQVVSNDLVSLDIGVLKEELDADGGSGFSFGDLLADRAGTMFAKQATESESAARAMQRRIIQSFVEADFVPDGHDLPEGLSEQQFQQQFGGVGGDRYQQLVDEIDRRIENAPAYRD